MDLSKKTALIKWLDALGVQKVTCFEDVKDVRIITDILSREDLLPPGSSVENVEQRLQAVKAYLEGFYRLSSDGESLINFRLLGGSARGDAFELEMGKLLLALLGCVIQDKARERFIEPALQMDAQSQQELKEMIEWLLFVSGSDGIPQDFAEVLKRKTESRTAVDAAVFFKLVADGVASSPLLKGTSSPTVSRFSHESAYTMYTNSPQSAANTSGINIRDISSPLRVMSLSSPATTPLGALMHSPQLVQKIVTREQEQRKQLQALLRQKIQEYKKLDIAYQNEQHLRLELQMDLEQRCKTILEKDARIQQLERQLTTVNKMRDEIDEMEMLRSDSEKLRKDVKDLQRRLQEQKDTKEQNQMLEREMCCLSQELASAREELKLMDLLKKSSEESRIQSHKHQLRVTELETSLEHCRHEVEQLHVQLEEANNMRTVAQEQYKSLKKEKEELEELFGSNQGGMGNSVPVFAGESMNIVTDKRLSELQAEYDQLKSTWVDPIEHDSLKKQLHLEEEARKVYEARYIEARKVQMSCEDTIEKLNTTIQQYKCQIESLESNLATSEEQRADLGSQLYASRESEDSLRQSEAMLIQTKEKNQAAISSLRKELSKLQTELQFTKQELDIQKDASESRRQTIAQLDQEKIQKTSAEQRLSSELKSCRSKAEHLEEQLKAAQRELETASLASKFKISSLEAAIENKESELEEKLDIIKSFEEKVLELNNARGQLNSENDKANKTIQEQCEEIQRLMGCTEELNSTSEDLRKELVETQQKVRKLEFEVESLNEKIAENADKYEQELTALRAEYSSLKTQYGDEMKTSNKQLEELRNGLAQEKQISEQNQLSYESEMSKVKTEYESEVTKLKEQILQQEELSSCTEKELEARVKNLIGEKETDAQLKEKLEIDISSLKSELESRTVEYSKSLQKLREELENDHEWEKTDLNNKIHGLEEDLARETEKGSQEIERREKEVAEIIANHEHERRQFKEEIEAQKNNVIAMKAELDEQVATLLAELKEEKESREAVTTEKCQLQSNYESQLKQLNEEHAKAVEELNSKIHELKQCVEILKGECDGQVLELQNAVEAKESERYELECCKKELETKLDSLVGQIELLKNSELSSSETIEKLQRENQLFRVSIEEKENDLTSAKEVLKTTEEQMHEVKRQLEQIQTECDTAKNALEEITAKHNDLESQHASYKVSATSEIGELKSKLSEVEAYWKSQCEQLEEEYANGTQDLRIAHEKQVEELEQCIGDKETFMNSQKEAYQQKVHQLEKAVHERGSEMDQVRNELKTVQSEKDSLQKELLSLKKDIEKLSEEKRREIEMLIGQYETQLDELKNSLSSEHADALTKCKSECEEKVTQLQTESAEQRVNYQQMMSDMEEKLGGEVNDLRGRLSQMKCQYEAVIETKEKELKKASEDWQERLEKLVEHKNYVEQQRDASQEHSEKLRSEMVSLSSKIGEYEKWISDSGSIQDDLNKKLTVSAEECQKLTTELASCRECLSSVEQQLSVSKEEQKKLQEEVGKLQEQLSHEKGEREELCTQLEYTREQNDTLSAELSSQQQQLAAVEEEKRQLEEQTSKNAADNNARFSQLEEQMERERQMMEVEKEELERQLQSSQKCFAAIQKSELELKQQVENLEQDVKRLTERNLELEQRLRAYLEQEHNLQEDNQHLRNRNTELNNNLQQQLREVKTLGESTSKLRQELEISRQNLKEREAKFDKQLRSLREEKTALEIENANLSKVDEKLKASETERERLQDITDKYNIHYNKKKEIIAQQEAVIKKQNQELDYFKRAEEKLTKEHAPLNEKYNLEVMKNKNLTSKIRTLEAQNDLADRKIREYKQQLEKANSVFLGDPSDFNKMLADRDNAEDASFMEKHPSSVPLNSSIDKENDVTLTPGTRNSRTRRRMSKSISTATVTSADNEDTISIGSATSLAYRLRSRESAVSLNRSVTSFDSCKSSASVPKGTGGLFHSEDEPMEFEWGRLGELSRRNTMCPSHLKTSYPVETQLYNPDRFQDDALRESTIGTESSKRDQPGSGRKRKQGWDTADSGSDSSDSKSSKHAKTGCVYQKPGPPTPANSRRSSKGSRSPNTRRNSGKGSSSRSPRTPLSIRGRRTPRRTPKQNTPKRNTSSDSQSAHGSGRKVGKRDSVAYNIGFSPLSMGHSHRLTRQQAFIQKQPPSSTQLHRRHSSKKGQYSVRTESL